MNNQVVNFQKVLVLNASYEPINICGVKRAIILVVTGVASTEEETSLFIRSPSVVMKIPAVIRLVEYVKISYRSKALSKKNIFLRDQYTCQYCGKKFDVKDLTLDHVLPKSRSGKSTWENLVTACKKCNVKKGDRTPKEAGLTLTNKPRSGSITFLHIVRFKGKENDQWKKYLFY